jgi:hedgehog/intein hint domain protein
MIKKSTPFLDKNKQGKHDPNHHNYQCGKSILSIDIAEKILIEYSGTGILYSNGGQREVVDTNGTYNGIWLNEFGDSAETSRFTIHHSKSGAHVVPSTPAVRLMEPKKIPYKSYKRNINKNK